MTFDYASAVAVDYWAKKDVTVPCQATQRALTWKEVHTFEAYYGFIVDMVAYDDSCEIGVSPGAEENRTDPDEDWLYCAEIVHEFGHLGGLDDNSGGIMDEDWTATPFGCAHPRQWAVLKGWRDPPRWVRDSPRQVQRLWLSGRSRKARSAWRRLR